MKKVLALILLLSPLAMSAQEDPEYRLELGAGASLVSYLGDFNDRLLTNLQPMGSLVAKYKMNPRMAWAFSIGYGQLKGSSENAKTYYPEVNDPVNFTTRLVDATLRYEYNFWPFGTGREYRGAQRLTPFLTLGLGLTFAKSTKSVVAGKLPLGFGIKYKVADRLNIAAEWVVNFTGTDMLDGAEDPYGIKSSGLFKNKDGFSTLGLTLTYELWEKCKTCNNDRE